MTARLPLIGALALLAAPAGAQMRVLSQPSHSPLVTFRIVFTAGAATDPESKPGLAFVTAQMIANGGSKTLTYQQIEDAMFPLAADFDAQVDKEMTTFFGSTHVDNLEAYYKLVRGMLLEPAWRDDDFKRVKDDCINAIKAGLRNNDEELAKEALYSDIYRGMSYGRYTGGTVTSLEAITLDDVKHFYASHYAQGNLILGLSGGFSPEFLERVKRDFRQFPPVPGFRARHTEPALIRENRVTIVEKDARATAISLGFPVSCTRQNPDFPALLVAASYLGQHRMSGSVLYDEMREKRGLNYGDYAYIEYFPRGMFQMEASPNLARHYQIFQLWIRPVQPSTAKFALRLALYELDRMIKSGIPEDGFQMSRDFVLKHANLLMRTQTAQLGYAEDSLFYDRPNFADDFKLRLANLTAAEVSRVVRRYLRADQLCIAIVASHADELKQQLISDDPSPMTYNTPKAQSIMDIDRVVENWPLHLKAEFVTILSAERVFQ
jgi:zinc protease